MYENKTGKQIKHLSYLQVTYNIKRKDLESLLHNVFSLQSISMVWPFLCCIYIYHNLLRARLMTGNESRKQYIRYCHYCLALTKPDILRQGRCLRQGLSLYFIPCLITFLPVLCMTSWLCPLYSSFPYCH